MESTLNKGVVHAWGNPLGYHPLQETCYEGLLALFLDNIIGEMIDNEKSGHTNPPHPPERSQFME